MTFKLVDITIFKSTGGELSWEELDICREYSNKTWCYISMEDGQFHTQATYTIKKQGIYYAPMVLRDMDPDSRSAAETPIGSP